VTLTGHVRSYSERTAALRAVRRIRGVRAIADEIHIRIPDGEKTADDQIASRAAAILGWGSSLPSNSVQVIVRAGWVTLTGKVDWYYQRVTAEEDVHRLAGVRGVINNITVSARLRPADVQRRIVDALKRNAQIDADQIQIAVEDGAKVVLRRQVKNWDELHAVETGSGLDRAVATQGPGHRWPRDVVHPPLPLRTPESGSTDRRPSRVVQPLSNMRAFPKH
jgi:osmotically-inducible protein OsmY